MPRYNYCYPKYGDSKSGQRNTFVHTSVCTMAPSIVCTLAPPLSAFASTKEKMVRSFSKYFWRTFPSLIFINKKKLGKVIISLLEKEEKNEKRFSQRFEDSLILVCVSFCQNWIITRTDTSIQKVVKIYPNVCTDPSLFVRMGIVLVQTKVLSMQMENYHAFELPI